MTPLVHKHVIIRAEVLNPPTDENLVSDSVKDLIERIGMKLLMGPYAKYVHMEGNRGLTVASIGRFYFAPISSLRIVMSDSASWHFGRSAG